MICARLATPVIYDEGQTFEIGKGVLHGDGIDATVFATGVTVSEAIKAQEELKQQGINIRVIDIHTIKPIDRSCILSNCEKKLMVSVEEHNVVGGLGTAIADVLSEERNTPPLLKLGVQDHFMPVGDYNYLLEQAGLTPVEIAESISNKLSLL